MNKLYYHIMRKTWLLTTAVMAFALTGCEKDDDSIVPRIVLGSETVSASNSAADYEVEFVTNQAWQASANVDWISIPVASGEKGKQALAFSVAENQDDERTGTITIAVSEGVVTEIEIVQDPGNRNDIFVKVDGTGDGTSWAKATTLDEALGLAVDGNVIHIAAGTYVPGVTVSGGDPADDGDKSFQIAKNITLKGGYPADAAAGAESDPAAHKSILSGAGTAYHVVLVSAPAVEGQRVVLQGLTITEGNAGTSTAVITINGVDFRRDYAGGLIAGNTVLEVLDTEIVNNASRRHVAGVYVFGGSEATFREVKVNENASAGNGGGAWISESTAYVYDSEFNENSGGTAPGFHAYPDATTLLYNTIIANNKGRSFGAAYYARQDSRGVLVNCLITGNTSTSPNGGGGVMMYSNCEIDIISSTITDNEINGPGGGVYRRLGTNVLSIHNSIIAGNTQKDDGPDVDVYEVDADPAVVRSSVIGTAAFDATGAAIGGSTFNPATMFGAGYLPTGDSNPALTHGMTGNALVDLGAGIAPPADADYLGVDLHGNARGSAIMGAVVAAP